MINIIKGKKNIVCAHADGSINNNGNAWKNTIDENKLTELIFFETFIILFLALDRMKPIKKAKIKLVDVKNRCPGKNTDGTI